MLILVRHIGESIVIGGNIIVEVMGIRRDGSVRLGIEAPKEVAVDRSEIHQQKLARPDGKPEGER